MENIKFGYAITEWEWKKIIDQLRIIMGFREKEVFQNLAKIENIQSTKDYNVLRFWHKDGEHYFDYETKLKRITG